MSHYAVAVFHRADQDINELLAPYDENLEVEPYIQYSREEAIEYAKQWYKTDGKSDEECWKLVAEDRETDGEGNIYTTYNPQSKWDWWQEGGRWADMLKLKSGKYADSARVCDIDFSPDDEVYQRSLRFWDVVVEHKPKEEGEDFFTIYNEQYYRDFYNDRESYARQQAAFSTYAVVTPDGEWHAPGEMGWFGCSSESGDESIDWYSHYKECFIDAADPDWILTIVDCHI